MLKKSDPTKKTPIWFLIQPEDSSEISQTRAVSYSDAGGFSGEGKIKGIFKAALWIMFSILLSLFLACLN